MAIPDMAVNSDDIAAEGVSPIGESASLEEASKDQDIQGADDIQLVRWGRDQLKKTAAYLLQI